MVIQTIQRPTARISKSEGDRMAVFGGISPTVEIPTNTVIALDVHGTLISRNQADDLEVVRAFRQVVSKPAKTAGAKVIMASAAPTRELHGVARLLDLGDQPAVAELGHLIMPAVLEAPPQIPSSVTPELLLELLDIKRWLVSEGLPPGVFIEPKSIIVSLNWSKAPKECDRLVDSIQRYISKHRLPLYVSISDATLDIGIVGINKASGLHSLIDGVVADSEGANILAVGDSRNDMDLLKVSVPGLCGCPSNSHPMVKEYVIARGGVVSDYPYLAGTLDAVLQLLQRIALRRSYHVA